MRPTRRGFLLALATMPIIAGRRAEAASFESLFAPGASLDERWLAHDAASGRAIDHSAFDRFLSRYVVTQGDGSTGVRYAAVTIEDRQELGIYIDTLRSAGVSGLARSEQFALWANLYNALTLKLVLDHFPVASIRDIRLSKGVFGGGPWDAQIVEVEGKPLSLNDIEHRILRPIWSDARIHYAVNCASVGCPDLAARASRGADLEPTLDALTRAYVGHPRGFRIDGGKLVVSKIYGWYQEDFGGNAAGVIAHLRHYATPERAALLDGRTRIDDYDYDWSLNGAP